MKIKQAAPAPAFPPITITIESAEERDDLVSALTRSAGDGGAPRRFLLEMLTALRTGETTECRQKPEVGMDPLFDPSSEINVAIRSLAARDRENAPPGVGVTVGAESMRDEDVDA